MNKVFLFLLLLAGQQLYAQQVVIPYRKGNLYGLSDAKGKLLMVPAYDDLSWMEGNWFRTERDAELKDTIELNPGYFFRRNTQAKLTGLVHDGKPVLADEPFGDYEIVANKCIVAKAERRAEDLTKEQFKKYGDRRRWYSLFNLKGRNLYPENFKRIQKIDTTGVSEKVKGSARYILFLTVDLRDKKSLFVFDADRQEISDWLIRGAYKLQGTELSRISTDKHITFTVTDSNYVQLTQALDYSGGKFVLSTLHEPAPAEKRAGNSGYEVTNEPRAVEVTDERIDAVKVPYDMAVPREQPAFRRYYIFVKDSLFYMTDNNERTALSLPSGSKVLLKEPLGMTQYSAVTVKHDGHFYLVNNGVRGSVAYDSLIYFGEYFLAWQKINDVQRAGVIRGDGTPVIPMQYDSLWAGIRYLNFENKNTGAAMADYQPVLKEEDSRYSYNKRNPYTRSYTDMLTVFINGKAGVLNMKGDTVIPMEYQVIARNNIGHSRPRTDDFILLKKDNRYGFTSLVYSREKQHSVTGGNTIAPRYRYIPGFYYANYFGIKSFKLVGLYDEHFNFKGYADEAGKEFFEE